MTLPGASRMVPDGTYLVLPDMQIPYHDKRAVAKVLTFAKHLAPTGILCVGDEADAPEVSRWTRGRAGEYAGTFEAGLVETHDVVRGFSEIAPMHIVRSNHTSTRIANYLGTHAPALSDLSVLQYDRLMGFNGHRSALTDVALNVTWHPQLWGFAPGWVLAHGDEGSLSRVPGSTAMGLARKIGASVVCGHTHRAGIQHSTQGFAGRVTRTLIGVEVGHLMDMRQVSYLKTGVGDWQQALGILTIERRRVFPQLALIDSRGHWIHHGRIW